MAAAIQLPPLVQRIILDPSTLAKGTKTAVASNKTLQKSAVTTAASIGTMGGSLNTLAFRAQTTGNILMKRLGIPILAVGGIAAVAFAKFEESMVRIESLVGVSTSGVERFTQAVKETGRETGRGPQELADAMFFVASAGLRGATAMEVLNASAKGAAIGLGQTKVVVDAATSAVNAYGAENLSGTAAVDVLTAAVREGKVEADRLAPAIGKAIPVASAMGIEFHEVAAAIASMTRTGTDARTSAIQLRQIMQSILDPSRQTERALREMGIAQGELADQARERGLLSVLKRLRELANENEEAFADVFPNVRALAGALDITGENLAENEQIFHALANSAGDTNDAFQRVQETAAFKFQRAMAELKVAFIELGESMTPLIEIATALLRGLAQVFEALGRNRLVTSFMLALGLLTFSFGALLKTVGMTGAALSLWSIQAAGAGTAAAAAGKGVALMTTAMKAIPFIAVTAGLVTLGAVLFNLFGRGGPSRAERLGKLKEEIADIKVVAGEALKPIDDFTEKLDGLGRSFRDNADRSDAANAFFDQFQQVFDDVKDLNVEGGGQAVAFEAFIRRFAGQANNSATRQAFEDIHKELGQQFGEGFEEFKKVIFGTSDLEEIFSLLIGGDGTTEGAIAAARISGKIIADNYADEITDIFNERLANLDLARGNDDFAILSGVTDDILALDPDMDRAEGVLAEGLQQLEDQFTTLSDSNAIQDARDSLKADIAEILKDVGDFQVDDVFGVREQIFDAIFDLLPQDIPADEMASVIQGVNLAIADELRHTDEALQDGFKQVFDGLDEETQRLVLFAAQSGFNDPVLIRALGFSEGIFDVSKMDARQVSGMRALGEGFEAVMKEAEIMKKGLSDLEEGSEEFNLIKAFLDSPEGSVQQFNAVQNAISFFVKSMIEDIEDVNQTLTRGKTIEDIFGDIESAIAKASAAADEFGRRFDLLFGVRFTADEAFGAMQASIQDMMISLRESGGAFDQFTKDGRAARDSIRDAVTSGVEGIQAMISTGELSATDAGVAFENMIENIKDNLRTVLTEAEIDNLFGQLGLNDLAGEFGAGFFLGTDGNQLVTDENVLDNVDAMVADISTILSGPNGQGVGTAFMEGIEVGMNSALTSTEETARNSALAILDAFKGILGIKSPSVVFAEEVGEPITAGIAKGMLDRKQQIRFTIKELVNDAISSARFTINSVSRAIEAQLNFDEAKRAHEQAVRDFGQEGEITKREALSRRQLQRRVEEAKRALRLGQGHQEDLELSLLDAQNALDDFDNQITSGGPVTRANISLMDAGFEMAQAMAVMKMEGQKAIDLFTNLGNSVGIPADRIDEMLSVASQNEDIFRSIFGPDVIDAIERAADAFLIISKGGSGGDDTPDDYIPFALGGISGERYTAGMMGSVEMDTGVYSAAQIAAARQRYPMPARTMHQSETFGGHGRVSQGGGMGVYIMNPEELGKYVSTTVDVLLTGVAKTAFQIQKIKQQAHVTLGEGGTGYGIF